jgi:hypothetical protein
LPFLKPREEWTKVEARDVLAWLMGQLEPRTDKLLQRLGLAWTGGQPGLLDEVERSLPQLVAGGDFISPSPGPQRIELRGHVFEQDPGPLLSAYGEALGADLGLLIARSLQANLGAAAKWVIGSHGRTYVSNNLPVLRTNSKVEFDPLRVGLVIARQFVVGATPQWRGLAAVHEWWLRTLSAGSAG